MPGADCTPEGRAGPTIALQRVFILHYCNVEFTEMAAGIMKSPPLSNNDRSELLDCKSAQQSGYYIYDTLIITGKI
jgi:hypothetical protein